MTVKQFSDLELADMFNVDCTPNAMLERSSRNEYIAEQYVFNDIKVPLWSIVKRPLKRGFKHVMQHDDNIKPGVSQAMPGTKERVADLAKWYAEHTEESAFEDE